MNNLFMQKAIDEALGAGNEIPVGAVIVKNGNIIAIEHNQKEALNDVTAHAEILALRNASKELHSWRLNGCDLYVTLEPCPMCLWAIIQSRIDNLYFGSYDSLYGAISTMPHMISFSNSKIKYKGGIMEQECDLVLKNYFKRIREEK